MATKTELNANGKGWNRPGVSQGKTALRGQSLIELALIFPFLMLLLAGLVDLGRGVQVYVAVTNAAGEGARFGMREPANTAGIQQRVRNELADTGITPTSIVITYPNGADSPGNPIRVQVNYTYTTILGFFLESSQVLVSKYVEMIIL